MTQEQTILGTIGNVLEESFSILHMVNDFFSIQLELILPVVVITGLIAGLLKIRERFPKFKNTMLVALAFIVGCVTEAYLGEGQTAKEMIRGGFILGSFSAVSYQFIKPFIIKIGESIVPWFTNVLVSTIKAKIIALLGQGGDDER